MRRHKFSSVKLPAGDGVTVVGEWFYGDRFADHRKVRRLLGERPDSMGIQRLELGGVPATAYYFVFRENSAVARAIRRAGAAAKLMPGLMVSASLGCVCALETRLENGEIEPAARRLFQLAGISQAVRCHTLKRAPMDPRPCLKPLPRPFLPSVDLKTRIKIEPGRHIITKLQIDTDPDAPRENLGPGGDLIPFRPRRLNPSRILGRSILEWTPCAGTYGMGGLGLVGLRLGEIEWLIFAIRGASDWILLDGKAVSGRPERAVERRLLGATVAAFRVGRRTMRLKLGNGAILEIKASPDSRPNFQGTGEPRKFAPREDLRSGVFLAPSIALWG